MNKTHMVVPSLVLVVYKGCTKTSSWVDTSPSNRNRSQMHQKDSKTNRQWCQNLTNSEFYKQINYQNKRTYIAHYNINMLNREDEHLERLTKCFNDSALVLLK